jgi:ATP phosphoribosyltransferase regulatory subunit/ATP phosphoribosyltransferase
VADYFGADARQRRQLETTLLDIFRTWGYQDVIPPTFEYADTVELRASSELRAETYRFLDRHGNTLALRPDMTIAVARLVGTRLHDWPMPQRFCYAGPVYRYAKLQAGRQGEFWQAGVELIGAPGPEADAEVLALTCQALEAVGLRHYRLALGQIGYFDGLLQALHLTPQQQTSLQRAVDHNSEAELAAFLAATPLSAAQRNTLEKLPWLRGDSPEAILAQARAACLNDKMHQAVDNLAAVLRALEMHKVAERVHLDLTEIHNLGYYTGISFEALTPGLGFPLASGGRYDQLVGSFGKPQPAVGVAVTIDRILSAQQRNNRQAIGADAQNEETTRRPLVIALPKGRLAEETLHLFQRAQISPPAPHQGRKLVLTSEDSQIHYMMAKPSDVPTYVEYGAADLGVCGLDVLRENEHNVYEPLLLPFGHCRLSLAGPANRADMPLRYLSQARVASKFPHLAGDFFRQRGINAEIIELQGSVELGPLVGLADYIVDLVQTGETLRANGLAELRTILHSQAVLIVNRASLRLKMAEIESMIDRLRCAMLES